MKLDFSKNPDGATHYADNGLRLEVCVWYKNITVIRAIGGGCDV